jgi:hypothetical protein
MFGLDFDFIVNSVVAVANAQSAKSAKSAITASTKDRLLL